MGALIALLIAIQPVGSVPVDVSGAYSVRSHFHCAVALAKMFSPEQSKGYRKKLSRGLAKRMSVCLAVAARSSEFGLSIAEVVAIGFYESKFTFDAKSSVGALGPLQVLPRYFCPNKRARGCDLVAAGLTAIKKFKAAYGENYQCHYNSGRHCNRRSRLYAKKVRALMNLLKLYDAYVFSN